MELEQINDISIKPLISNKVPYSKKTVRGFDYYPEPYANICMLARKKSGKTNAVYRALEECVPQYKKDSKKKAKIIIFCSSVNTDDTYKAMIKMLKEKNCEVMTFENFIQDGHNILDELVNALSAKNDVEDEKKEKKKKEKVNASEALHMQFNPYLMFGGTPGKNGEIKPEEKKEKKEKKDKLLTPEYFLIFDDLSSAMNHKSVSRLLTKNRHMKMKIFICAHHVNNLATEGRRMIDYFHVFPNISDEKIQELGEGVGIMHKGDDKKHTRLQDCYNHATSEPYNFLTIDIADGGFRKNYSHRYLD